MEEDDEISKIIEQLTEEGSGFKVSPGVTIDDWDVSHVFTDIDYTYGVSPEATNPEVYTSHEQRAQHEKYPALKKAWEDYLHMYNLTKGDAPIVD